MIIDTLPVLPDDKKWEIVFQDEFNGGVLDSTKWQPTGCNNPRRDGWWLDSQSKVSNGKLVITTEKTTTDRIVNSKGTDVTVPAGSYITGGIET